LKIQKDLSDRKLANWWHKAAKSEKHVFKTQPLVFGDLFKKNTKRSSDGYDLSQNPEAFVLTLFCAPEKTASWSGSDLPLWNGGLLKQWRYARHEERPELSVAVVAAGGAIVKGG
jgi:hypothetical protein